MKAKRSIIILSGLLKSFEKTDSQIISWRDSKLKIHERNNTFQTFFLLKLLEYSSDLEMLFQWSTLPFPVLFDRYTFFKKHEIKKHEAHIQEKLRNT